MIKLEDPPTPPKISNILKEIPNISIFGGLGGAFFLEELRARLEHTCKKCTYSRQRTRIPRVRELSEHASRDPYAI